MRSMTQPAKGQEPSMEEILASIRRIIADDDPARNPPKASEPARVAPPREPEVNDEEIDSMLAQLQGASRPAAAPVEEPAADILDLTEQMAVPEPAPSFRTIDGQSDVVFDEVPPEPPPARVVQEPRPFPQSDRGLISASTSAAVDSAFNTLAQTVLVQNGRTLEDLVREMLRPMLKTWLDDNLPGMVERLVRAEIERVSRGRG
jgi:cell pole-organizing protein PopZ